MLIFASASANLKDSGWGGKKLVLKFALHQTATRLSVATVVEELASVTIKISSPSKLMALAF